MEICVTWGNTRNDSSEQTWHKGTSMQITYEDLRDESGEVIAHFDHGLGMWVRLDDMSTWTDITWTA